MGTRVHDCWLEVFYNRVKELEKINKVLPESLWSTELLILGAADYIELLEDRLHEKNKA